MKVEITWYPRVVAPAHIPCTLNYQSSIADQRVVVEGLIVEARIGFDNEGLGMDAFRVGCLGAQNAWALTASPAPQHGNTPLWVAVQEGNDMVARGKDEVARILREAGALE